MQQGYNGKITLVVQELPTWLSWDPDHGIVITQRCCTCFCDRDSLALKLVKVDQKIGSWRFQRHWTVINQCEAANAGQNYVLACLHWQKTNQASKAGFKFCENRNPPRRNTMRVLVLQYTRILSHPSLWVRHREIHWDMLKWATHNSSTGASATFKHSSPKHPKQSAVS